jgi:phosphatidylglycerophosphate synthase
MQNHNNKIRRPSDSFFTNLFARSISVHISPLVARTKITPLQVTIIGLLFGLFAAWIGSKSIWSYGLIAALLMEISHVLDCVDGELARLTDRGNPFAASLDPISDRIKDIAIVYAAYLQSLHSKILNLSEFQISTIALFTIGLWFLYMYIVDAFLNPAKKKKTQKTGTDSTQIYLGLYDLFIYGSIMFWILHIFEYFIIFVLFMSIIGILIQIYRLHKIS